MTKSNKVGKKRHKIENLNEKSHKIGNKRHKNGHLDDKKLQTIEKSDKLVKKKRTKSHKLVKKSDNYCKKDTN